jgi:quercetin 2,3-dioxygenase
MIAADSVVAIREKPMTFEYLKDPARGPQWQGLLPGAPEPFFLRQGEGEHAKLFGDLFTVLVSGDETGGQFGMIHASCPAGDAIPAHAHEDTNETFYIVDGKVRVFVEYPDGTKTSRLLEPGDFAFVPARLPHAYRVESAARMLGVLSGGFERFFQHMGTPADTADPGQPPFVPALDQIIAAGQQHGTRFFPDLTWPEPE